MRAAALCCRSTSSSASPSTSADFDKASLDSGKVDGKLYGVNLGINSNAMIYNKAAFQKAGVAEPVDVNWEKFVELAAAVTKAHNGEYYGTSDGSGEEPPLENWLRQRGKALFTEDGKLGFDEKDAGDWFGMWAKTRETKACPPADLQALDKNDIETNLLTRAGRMRLQPFEPVCRLPGAQQEHARHHDVSAGRRPEARVTT